MLGASLDGRDQRKRLVVGVVAVEDDGVGELRACRAVSVPVLSIATVLTRARSSRAWPPLMSTPSRAARPTAETTATGIEITSEHGQATISSASARYSQVSTLAAERDRDDERRRARRRTPAACRRARSGRRSAPTAPASPAPPRRARRRAPAWSRSAALVARTVSAPWAFSVPANTRAAGLLVDRDRLAGDRRLVDAGGAVDDVAVERRCARPGGRRSACRP